VANTNAPVTATVGGVPAEVTYAGTAPTIAAGVTQINVRVPDGLPANPATPILLTVGSVTTPPGVTVAIQ
jgi:trimeric autotransporter adhesin